MKLYNTLTRKVEEFAPLTPPKVGMYACGPTVYDYTHIGHLKKYVGDDILKKTLNASGFDVTHVMNITDVGHLSSDADEGDDKLEKGAKERNMSVWEVAQFFEDYFFKTTDEANIDRPNIVANATKHINEQIQLIQKLEKNGFTYTTEEAVYFDVSKFPTYGALTGQKLEDKKIGVRDEVVKDENKKNPADFALWFFTVGRFSNHAMKWPSPWGEGFPGWHIECSAMSMEYLGDTLDIHTGGVDHIPVHHTNEIAQSEGATGKTFVRFWVHNNFLNINQLKMSKSQKNFFTLEDIKQKGFDPLSLRYLFLTGHYRDELNFTWDALQAAQNALTNIRDEVRNWDEPTEVDENLLAKFMSGLQNDVNTPQALAVLHELIKSGLESSAKSATILKMDEILGLGLKDFVAKPIEVPESVSDLISQREVARNEKDFKKSDELRDEIKKLGFDVLDTPSGPKVKKVS